MNDKVFDVFTEKHIGIGFRWQEWNGKTQYSLALPFLTFVVTL
jgi:hypothetical protein